jgi:hypothetical protein
LKLVGYSIGDGVHVDFRFVLDEDQGVDLFLRMREGMGCYKLGSDDLFGHVGVIFDRNEFSIVGVKTKR